MSDSPDPYIPKKANDLIRADEWNSLQVRAREEIQGHTHAGGDKGAKLGTDALQNGAVTLDKLAEAAKQKFASDRAQAIDALEKKIDALGELLQEARDDLAKLRGGELGEDLRAVVNDASQTGVGRGLWLWNSDNSNHVIYSVNPTGKSPAGEPAPKGLFDEGHRLRLRTHDTQGFLFENQKEEALLDIQASDGSLWTKGRVITEKKLDIGREAQRVEVVPDEIKFRHDQVVHYSLVSGDSRLKIKNTSSSGAGDPNAGNNYDVLSVGKSDVTAHKLLKAADGVQVGTREKHIEADGAIYRKDGQVYLTVDDHFYVRDKDAADNTATHHFNTNNGDLTITGSLHLGEWSLVPSGRTLFIRQGKSTVAALSSGFDKLTVYRGSNGKLPALIYNQNGTCGEYNGSKFRTQLR